MNKNYLFSLLLVAFTACAPNLGSRLNVEQIPDGPLEEADLHLSSRLRIQLLNFTDARKSEVVGEINGRQLTAAGDVALSVRQALERYLRASGALVRPALGQANSVEGEITEWLVKVQPAFPVSEAEGSASIKLRVRNQEDKVVYVGNYSANSVVKHPALDEAQVEKVLGEAMGYALVEALKDPDFVQKISNN